VPGRPVPRARARSADMIGKPCWPAVRSLPSPNWGSVPWPAVGAVPLRGAQDPRSSGRAVCSHRGRPAEKVAHPAARRGERDPQRIADDDQEQGGSRWQAHGHSASRPVTVLDNRCPPASGAAAHPPRHVPVHWLTGHQDHRGENDRQRPRGKGDSRLDNRPCTPHPVRISRAGYRRERWRTPSRGARAGTRINMAVRDERSYDTASRQRRIRRSERLRNERRRSAEACRTG